MNGQPGKCYRINKHCLLMFVNDGDDEQLNFHIKADDYFGTLATIIDLMQQEKMKLNKTHHQTLDRIKQDLMKLQKEYRIVKK